MSLTFVIATVAVASAIGSIGSVTAAGVIHERRSTIPTGWSLQRRADPDLTIPLSFALAQPNVENLEAYLLDVADPASPNYGKHWTASRVAKTFHPTPETVGMVHAWLTGDGGLEPSRVRLSRDGGYFDLDLTVAEAERLLTTEYYVYQHHDGTQHIACEHGYQLPKHLVEHIDTVWPTIQFDVVPLSQQVTQRVGGHASAQATLDSNADYTRGYFDPEVSASCDKYTTLACLRALYNYHPDPMLPQRRSIGIVEFGKNTLKMEDLDMFFEIYSPSQVGHRPEFFGIDGGILNESETNFDRLLEPNLDFQYVMGLLGKYKNVMLYQVTNEGGPDFDHLQFELFLNALDASFCTYDDGNPPWLSQYSPENEDCGNKTRADVISISYLQAEDDFGLRFAARQCYEYGKLSLMGTTFLISSGDTGVAGRNKECMSQDGSRPEDSAVFVPYIGNMCPYVTSVGATQVKKGFKPTDPNPEEAANVSRYSFKSGGGFSNVIQRPAFQNAAVRHYIDNFTGNISSLAFNRFGRAYPDVSSNGHMFRVVINGRLTSVYGTSASAPTWAAMIASVNDARASIGKGPVGWANPALYSDAFADVFHDITEGDNFACGPSKNLGFVTAPGWDPVTGLGTPDFSKLLKAWMELP